MSRQIEVPNYPIRLGTRVAWDDDGMKVVGNRLVIDRERTRTTPRNLWSRGIVVGYGKGRIELATYTHDPKAAIDANPVVVEELFYQMMTIPVDVFTAVYEAEEWVFPGEPTIRSERRLKAIAWDEPMDGLGNGELARNLDALVRLINEERVFIDADMRIAGIMCRSIVEAASRLHISDPIESGETEQVQDDGAVRALVQQWRTQAQHLSDTMRVSRAAELRLCADELEKAFGTPQQEDGRIAETIAFLRRANNMDISNVDRYNALYAAKRLRAADGSA